MAVRTRDHSLQTTMVKNTNHTVGLVWQDLHWPKMETVLLQVKEESAFMQMLLHKRGELKELWIEGIEHKHVLNLLDEIENIKQVPQKLEQCMASKHISCHWHAGKAVSTPGCFCSDRRVLPSVPSEFFPPRSTCLGAFMSPWRWSLPGSLPGFSVCSGRLWLFTLSALGTMARSMMVKARTCHEW